MYRKPLLPAFVILAAAFCFAIFVLVHKIGGNTEPSFSKSTSIRDQSEPADSRPRTNGRENRKRFERLVRAVSRARNVADLSGEPDVGKVLSPDFEAAMRSDQLRFSAEESATVDRLYKIGMKEDSPDAEAALAELYRDYPTSNRGGCAAMNLAARYLREDKTKEAVSVLSSLIENKTESVFANGEKVLPKALFRLGLVKQDQGDEEGAAALFRRIRESFADAVDNEGIPYVDRIADIPL